MRLIGSFLGLLIPTLVLADCNYQLVSAELQNCKVIPNTEVAAQDSTEDVLPEETNSTFLTRVRCTCAETLRGSNPLCEFDREREIQFYIPQDQLSRCKLSPALLCREHC